MVLANSNYIIAIPSYKRSELIYQKTLSTLASHYGKSPPIPIYVFLADKQQLTAYHNARPPNFPIPVENINFVIGEKGLKNQRNFIMDYFPVGQCIVQMDDDIDDVLELVINKQQPKNNKVYRLTPIVNLHQFIIDAFKRCYDEKAYIWGIYPVPNAYFMTPSITIDLRFIVGPMFGIINRHRNELKLTTNEKENVERTLQYFTLDGKVIRFNNITVQTRYFKTLGGMQASLRTSARRANAARAAEYLHNLYPGLTKIHLGKKSKWPELLLLKNKTQHINQKTNKKTLKSISKLQNKRKKKDTKSKTLKLKR